jgi:uncharacterized membrane protein YqgA involved in biofilm formation
MDLIARVSGTLVNMGSVLLGTGLGLALGGQLSAQLQRVLMQVLGLVVLYIGAGMAQSLSDLPTRLLPGVLIALIGLAAGGLLGEALRLEEGLDGLGNWLKRRLRGSGQFSEGFITASLLFCVGPLTLIGALQNGLDGASQTLVLKSVLDGISSVALSGVYGIGVGFSALVILVLEGGISLAAAGFARGLPHPHHNLIVLAITGCGGLMVVAIGINLLLAGLEMTKKLRVTSLLPALILVPLLAELLRR